MELIVGTCGYDYPEWVGEGRFYPAGLARTRQDWLTYYASQFSIGELNFTYYGETSTKQMGQMLSRTDPARKLYLLEGEFAPRLDFKFVSKTYASLTHRIDSDWREHARNFIRDIKPLYESAKLLGVLAQFPSSARYSPEILQYVLQLAQELLPLQLIVEFRHLSWYADGIFLALADHGLIVAGVDVPREAKLPTALGDYLDLQPGVEAGKLSGKSASSFQYIRMHGRREGSWWSGDAASRYEYNYSDSTLARLAHKLMQTDSDRIYVCFNNHRFAQAPRNAVRLQEILVELLQKIKSDIVSI